MPNLSRQFSCNNMPKLDEIKLISFNFGASELDHKKWLEKVNKQCELNYLLSKLEKNKNKQYELNYLLSKL